MGSESRQLHIFFLPLMAQGHMIPMTDMAKQFASRGVKATIVTTPLNASALGKTIQRSRSMGVDVGVLVVKFPTAEAGLPEGCECVHKATLHGLRPEFIKATMMLEAQLDQLLQEHVPDCLVSDVMFPWATKAAAKRGIPRLAFNGTGFFALCASECIRLYEPYKNVSSDTEPFSIPHLPNDIKLAKNQLPDFITGNAETKFAKFMEVMKESEVTSYGAVVNSFYELERDYADYFRKRMGRKAWHIGPLSLSNKNIEDKAQRGEESSIDENGCLKWLQAKKPHSVIYICFGSMSNFSKYQLMQIAMALEASGLQFIWVVRKENKAGEKEEWFPEGFEKRTEGKGLVIKGWAPQVLILDHEAIGGFLTHCGWNSILEGVAAGVPMVTWPLAADQFLNETLVTQVLKIGVSVGDRKCVRMVGDYVNKEAIEKALTQIMGGEEAEEMRSRAKGFGKMAKRAVEEGGSSFMDLNSLIEELGALGVNKA